MILKFSQTLFQNMQHQIYNELTLSLIFSFHFPVCQRPFGFPLLFWSWRSVCGGSLSKSCILLNGRGFSFRLRSCYHLRRFFLPRSASLVRLVRFRSAILCPVFSKFVICRNFRLSGVVPFSNLL